MKYFTQFLQNYSPKTLQSFEAATSQRIEELESLKNKKLLDDHREFLELAGKSLGTFETYEGSINYDIESLIVFHKKKRKFSLDPRYDIFGIDEGGSMGTDFFLDRQAESGQVEVVWFTSTEELNPKSQFSQNYHNLDNMMVSLGYFTLRLKEMPFCREYIERGTNDAQFRLKFAETMMAQGFEPNPANGPWSQCFERGDSAAIIYQPGQFGAFVQIGFESEVGQNGLTDTLTKNLGIMVSSQVRGK